MGYSLTPTGFDAMNILEVFSKRLGPYGPSPTELELDYDEIKAGLGDQQLASVDEALRPITLYTALEHMGNLDLIEFSPD